MTNLPPREQPRVPSPVFELGMSSLVLGVIGLILFFLPVLGGPVSGLGLAFATAGVIGALRSRRLGLRWSLGGLAASGLALGVNLAIAYAPAGYPPRRDVPETGHPVREQPYSPPPQPSSGGPPQTSVGAWQNPGLA